MLLEWFVYYTYPKAERVIKEEFQKANFEVFLPIHTINRQWSDRVKSLEVPLFPNYIFIKSSKNEIYNIIRHPKIVKYVAFDGRPAVLKDKEVYIMQEISSNHKHIEIDYSLMIGEKVKIISGPLQGCIGTLIEKRGSKRFAIKLYELHQTMSFEIDIDSFEKLC